MNANRAPDLAAAQLVQLFDDAHHDGKLAAVATGNARAVRTTPEARKAAFDYGYAPDHPGHWAFVNGYLQAD